MSYTQQQGYHDGVKGTFFIEEVRGGPGNYPYQKKYFVAATDQGAVDTRNGSNDRPWERHRHQIVG